MPDTSIKAQFKKIFNTSCLRLSKISTFLKIELYASYIPLKNAKIYSKVNFIEKKYDFPQKTNENKVFLIFDP